LHRFQKRHGIGAVTISGEQRSADTQAADNFPAVLKEQMKREQVTPEQVYNADETGLYWKMLPDRTLAVKTDVKKT
jgi:hypothetical protein